VYTRLPLVQPLSYIDLMCGDISRLSGGVARPLLEILHWLSFRNRALGYALAPMRYAYGVTGEFR
jgi:hypothetical protein